MGVGLDILIAYVYIPPLCSLCVYKDFCNTVNELVELANQPRKILVFTDFNLSHFDLNARTTSSIQQTDEHLNCIISFHQINHVGNLIGLSLDLVFSSDHVIQMTTSNNCLVSPDIHHSQLALTLVGQSPTLYIYSYIICGMWAFSCFHILTLTMHWYEFHIWFATHRWQIKSLKGKCGENQT